MSEETPDPIDHASKTKGLLWFAGACLIGLMFAFGVSPLAHAIPWRWEEKMASAFDMDAEKSCRSNPQARALLQTFVTRLYPVQPGDDKFSIAVHVEKTPEINAYAALAGNITINSGLLLQAKSPEELAGVVAHEIEHVRHRHIMQAVIMRFLTVQGLQMIFSGDVAAANWPDFFLRIGFGRAQEAQADREGLRRLQAAHIDNTGYKNFFERMNDGNIATDFLSDHPSNRDRVAIADKFKNENTTPIMSREDWAVLRQYCH